MYNFKKNAKLYIVELNAVGAATSQHSIEIYSDITASQTFDEQSYKRKTLHNLTDLHDHAVINNANVGNFSFTTPILNVAAVPKLLTLGEEYSTGNLTSFDIYIQSDNVIYKLTKCIVEGLTFNIEKNAVLTMSVSGTTSRIAKFGNVGSVTIPGTPVNAGSKTYTSVDRMSVSINGTILDSIAAINVDLKNDISWYNNSTINDAVVGNMVYPSSYVLQGRTLSGSITQFITSENTDTLVDTSTSSPIVISLYNTSYSSIIPILEFNLPSAVFTRRLNFEELINRVYDFRLNSNTGANNIIYKLDPTLMLDFLSMTPETFDSRITFSRGTNATLIDSTGKMSYAPANLVTNSVMTGGTAGTWGSGAVAPTGWTTLNTGSISYSADPVFGGVIATTTGVNQRPALMYTQTAEANSTFIFSAYVSSNSGLAMTNCFLAGNFPVGTVVTYYANGVVQTGAYVPLAGDRLSAVVAVGTTAGAPQFRIGVGTNGNISGTFAFYAPQIERVTYQTLPTTYKATTGTAYYGPRLDYDPVTLVAKGLLIEEARTNLLTYSSDWTNAAWSKTNATVTAAATTSPDGTVNAQKLEATTTAATTVLAPSATVAATSASFSVFVKQGTGPTKANTFALRNFTTATNLIVGTLNYSTGVFTYTTGSSGVTVTNVGNGWWRVVISVTSGVTSGDIIRGYVGFWGAAQTAGDFLYAYGAQLEAGAFATSYIPTVASTVTRAADVAVMTGTNFSSWYNQSEGTFVSQYSQFSSSASQIKAVAIASDGSANNVVYTYVGTTGLPNGLVSVGGATEANPSNPAISSNTAVKTAFAYKVNDFALVTDGGAAATDASGAVPTVSRLGIGTNSTGLSSYLNGHIRQIAYFNTRLPDAQLQSLTAPSAVTTLSLDFTSGSYTVGY